MRLKVSVIGAGHVGATTAQRIVERELADVVVVDIIPGVPQGKALDMLESAPVERFDANLVGSNHYRETRGSDLVIITAGLPRKPGMSRDDLLAKNAQIVRSITEQVMRYSPTTMILVVTNPMDIMTYLVSRVSRLPKQKVFGMGGVLDSARFSAFVAQELDVSVENVHTFVLGGHGDFMVPLARYSTVAGIPITKLLSKERLKAIIQRTRDGGAEIVNLLKTGSAYYAPSSSIVAMVEAILKDKKKILPCAAYLNGEYGYRGIYAGVPAKLGQNGVEEIMEIELTATERRAFGRSVEELRRNIRKLKL